MEHREENKDNPESPLYIGDVTKSPQTNEQTHLENGDVTKDKKLLLDNNKNETPRCQVTSPDAVANETSLTLTVPTANGKCPRNMSAPALSHQPSNHYLGTVLKLRFLDAIPPSLLHKQDVQRQDR